MRIIIDGQSGTGKSTIGSIVANILNYLCVDTGRIYREVAYSLYLSNIKKPSKSDIIPFMDFEVSNNYLELKMMDKNLNLQDETCGKLAADLAKSKEIKCFINDKIKSAICKKDVIVLGRNSAVNLFPDADIKILLEADLETRAQRRYNQLNKKNNLNEIMASLDYRDNTVKKTNAKYDITINTSTYDINDTVSKIIRFVHSNTLTLTELKHFLYSAYRSDTAYKTCITTWNPGNPTYGQCAVTAMIVYEFFGGCIQCGYYEKQKVWHYWNIIDDEVVDFTIDQFNDNSIKFKHIKNSSFEELYSHNSVRERYIILKNRMKKIQLEFWRVNDSILKCQKCRNVHSPAFYTVSLGEDCRILIVGEAPAKNGWRVTGKAWINEKGELVPTGKVLQKLLNEIGLNIFDIAFLEAIKCYPENGKITNEQKINCKKYCIQQIALLKPQIVLTMGKNATEYLLGKDVPFSKNIGNEFLLNTQLGSYKIIPIYHTSPVSPLSYKGNIEAFKHIKRLINPSSNNNGSEKE